MNSRPTYYRILALLLLAIYFWGSFRVIQPYLEYKVNYEYISTVLCINKEKPQMNCNGKCHLLKELKKAAEEESQKQESIKLIESEIIPSSQVHISFNNESIIIISTFPRYEDELLSAKPLNITPPPRN
jgi:hypothetical protein